MGFNFNLNGDEINCFEPEWDPNEVGHLAQRGPHLQLKLKLGQKRNYGRKWVIFLLCKHERREERKMRDKASSQYLRGFIG